MDFQKEIGHMTIKEKTFTLPDGQIVSVGKECFQCPEMLFKPHLAGHNFSKGIHEAISQVVRSCEIDTRRDMLGNIILAGGITKIPGFSERLRSELQSISSTTVRITASPNRESAVWLGGSISTVGTIISDVWISKQEYEETGCYIVDRKRYLSSLAK